MNNRRRNPGLDHASGDVVISTLVDCAMLAMCFVPWWTL